MKRRSSAPREIYLGDLFVITNAAAFIADPGDEAYLRDGRIASGSRKHIADFSDNAFLRCVVHALAIGVAGLVLESSYILANRDRRSRVELAIRDAEAERVEIAVLEAALALDEHLERLGLVRLYCGHRLLEHSLGLGGGAELALRKRRGREHEGDGRHRADHEFTKHRFSPWFVKDSSPSSPRA